MQTKSTGDVLRSKKIFMLVQQCRALMIQMALVATLVLLCTQPILQAQPLSRLTNLARLTTYQEVISHEVDGNFMRFALPSSPLTLQVQALNPSTGQWRSISTQKRPSQRFSRMKIPRTGKNMNLRVVATFPTIDAGRVVIPSALHPTEPAVTFAPSVGAQLYSIEARSAPSAAWSRVSTIAPDPTTLNHQVPLPPSIASTSEVRVVAVRTIGSPPYFVTQSLPPAMRIGPSRFAADKKIASMPLSNDRLNTVASPSVGNVATPPAIEESDIWKIRGNTMYFFNRLRGLQIIDASDPANPIMGSLELATTGEEMYLLGGNESQAERAILLATMPWSQESAESTRIYEIQLDAQEPQLKTFLDLPGSYQESRLIGNWLHIVSMAWSNDNGSWQPQTYVTTIDVSDNTLKEVSRRSFPFSASQVGATSRYLWLAADSPSDWTKQRLITFPIQNDGSLGNSQETIVGGRIQDKWKVGDTANGIAVVVQSWQDWEQVTTVETYQIDDSHFSKAGGVELIRGESLFATRFADNRCYVVTFRQTDPLWIVDLADPSQPKICGHLEVPGWSTYIHPVGDVLIAVGRDGGKVQVSLFDVSNPEQPTLAQRIDVGNSWSWSEAEWNEKAVKILEDSGLILIPVVETNGSNTSQRVCLVDFDASSRTMNARGVIDHEFSPRRATLLENGVIASISNRQLLLVDASNRDLPTVISDRVLAFGVDRVVVKDNVVLLFENAVDSWSSMNRKAVLRMSSTDDIDQCSGELELPCSSVSAAKVIGDRLVIVEDSSQYPYFLARTSDSTASTSQLSVWSIENPAQPQLLGRTSLPFVSGSSVQLLDLADGRVAIASRTRGWFCWVRPLPIVTLRNPSIMPTVAMMPPAMEFGGQGLQVAIAEIDLAEPAILGTWNLEGEGYSEISDVFSCGDLLALSFQEREAIQAIDVPYLRTQPWTANSARTWLQIVDLANPRTPMPWAKVQIPGEMLAITEWSRAGATVFARSGDFIAALGFNGESAPIIAETLSSHATTLIGSTLYAARKEGIERREFSSQTGTWNPATIWPLDQATGIHSLLSLDGGLAAMSQNQAWILQADGSFKGFSILNQANFTAAARSGDLWIVPAGEYGALTLSH